LSVVASDKMAGVDPIFIPISQPDAGQRLDSLISTHFSERSRAYLASLIRDGLIMVKGESKKPGYRVKAGDIITGQFPAAEPIEALPEPIHIQPVFEDSHILVINKQPGLVVHPAPGHVSGTLVNAILFHCPDMEGIGGKIRPGIVHRLDKDTSGCLVIAKTEMAHHHLAGQFKDRTVQKNYLAIVHGRMKTDSGVIDLPIGRHTTDRKKMSVHSHVSRQALTIWQTREEFRDATLIDVRIKTGRTHQIRVHCAAIHHPVVGDLVYGLKKFGRFLPHALTDAPRQMLHAWKLGLIHPATGTPMIFESPLPTDMNACLESLRQITIGYD